LLEASVLGGVWSLSRPASDAPETWTGSIKDQARMKCTYRKRADLTTLPLLRYHTPTMKTERRQPTPSDLDPYAGRWVALVHGQVTGVGWTAQEAHRAAQRNRPKDEPCLVFGALVEVDDMEQQEQEPIDDDHPSA
jgi:hypothetical protein